MYDVFISYNWGIKIQVKQLYEVLKSLNYKVWMDETDLNAGSSPPTAELATAIINLKVVHKNVSMSSTTWTRFQLNVGNRIFYFIVTSIYEVNVNYYIMKLLYFTI
jgi:hypothetical protein